MVSAGITDNVFRWYNLAYCRSPRYPVSAGITDNVFRWLALAYHRSRHDMWGMCEKSNPDTIISGTDHA